MSTQDCSSLAASQEVSDCEQEITDLLVEALGQERFEMWFSHPQSICCPVSQGQPTVRVQADSPFSLKRLQYQFDGDIRSAVSRICGPQAIVRYEVVEVAADEDSLTGPADQELAPATPVGPASQQAIPFQPEADSAATSETLRRRPPTLASFHFSAADQLLQASVTHLLQYPGSYSPFFLYGPTGCGKTHLLEAITLASRSPRRLKRCLYVSAEQFTTQFVGSLREGKGLPMFRRKFRELDLLAIDDIQFLAGKKATLAEFQQTLDHLVRLGKQVVLSADRSPGELVELGDEVCARLSGGFSSSILYPDIEGRARIAGAMAESRGFSLDEDVLEYLAHRLPRDVRRLSGAVNRLHAYWSTFGEPITCGFAEQVLGDLFTMAGPKCSSMVSIERAVCDLCGVKPAELKSPSRQKRISAARMLAMYLSREYTGSAYSEIGDYFGGRSHSTVIAAQRKVEKWLESEASIQLPHVRCSAREAVRRLESTLRIG